MTEQFAIHYAAQRAKEQGYDQYRLVYRDFTIPPNGTLNLTAYNELWLLLEISWGVIITSDYGQYCHFYKKGVTENTHEHQGQIEIVNTRKYQRNVRFLQIILNTKTDGTPC